MAEILCWRISKEIKGIHKKKYKISYLHFGGEKETRVRKGSEGQRDLDFYLIQSIQPAKMPCTETCFLISSNHNCQDRTFAQIIKHMFLRALTSLCLPVRSWHKLPLFLYCRGYSFKSAWCFHWCFLSVFLFKYWLDNILPYHCLC